ncbi:hypothetical protein ACOMHN_029640 [Nucella lapillus]
MLNLLLQMASTKRTRQVTPRRIETIILKDLQSLHKWKDGMATHSKERGHCYSSLLDDERLLCNETLEDLEEVWARPSQPKWAQKTQTKRSHFKMNHSDELSEDAEDLWAKPIKGKRAKKAQSKQTAWHQTQPQSAEPASPVNPSVVPPNSPVELSPASQPTPNPYITYLIQAWEAGSPVLVTSLDPSSQPTVHSVPGHEQSVTPAAVVSLRDSNVNLMLLHPEDVLVIPDSSREVISVPTHTAARDEEGEAAQCVPQQDGVLLHQRQSPVEFGEESVFEAEDDFLTSESSQENACGQDQVVPQFKPEE